MILTNTAKLILDRYNRSTSNIEYRKIGKIIKIKFEEGKNPRLLDVGSGLCNFLEYARENFSNLQIKSVDINKNLVDFANSKGFECIEANILQLPFDDDEFDIVHCSHVIEHLKYPDVITAIDELFRVTKKDGFIILRSPLVINHRFYLDIDHIRPYPPDAIINYFKNIQQQKVGNPDVTEVTRWYTKIAFEINYYRYTGNWVKPLNYLLKILWILVKFPKARPNNYGLVLQKR